METNYWLWSIIQVLKIEKGLTQVPFESSGDCLAGSTHWNETAPVPLQACVHPQSVAALQTHSMSVKMNVFVVHTPESVTAGNNELGKIKRENKCRARLLKLFKPQMRNLAFSPRDQGSLK